MDHDHSLLRTVIFNAGEYVPGEHQQIEQVLRHPGSDAYAVPVAQIVDLYFWMTVIGCNQVCYEVEGGKCRVYSILPHFDPGPTRPSRANGFVSVWIVLADAVASRRLEVGKTSSVGGCRPVVGPDLSAVPLAWAEPGDDSERASGVYNPWFAAAEAADVDDDSVMGCESDAAHDGILCQAAAFALLAVQVRGEDGLLLTAGIRQALNREFIAQAPKSLQHPSFARPDDGEVWRPRTAAILAMDLSAPAGGVPGVNPRGRIAACGRAAEDTAGWSVPSLTGGTGELRRRRTAEDRSGYDDADMAGNSCEALIGLAGTAEFEFMGLLRNPDPASEHSGSLRH